MKSESNIAMECILLSLMKILFLLQEYEKVMKDSEDKLNQSNQIHDLVGLAWLHVL